MPRRIVLLSNMRTGSSWLGNMLSNHEDIEYGKELLQEFQSAPAIEARIAICKKPLFLWKVQGYQVKRTPEALSCIYQLGKAEPESWVIFLRRKNLLDQFVSMELANLTKVYVRQLGDDCPRTPPFKVDPQELARFFQQEEMWWSQGAAIASQCFCSIEVWYENLLRDLPLQIENIQKFLKIDEWNYESNMRRTRYRAVRHQVSNFSELQRQFAGTHYAWFFDDDGGF